MIEGCITGCVLIKAYIAGSIREVRLIGREGLMAVCKVAFKEPTVDVLGRRGEVRREITELLHQGKVHPQDIPTFRKFMGFSENQK